VEVNGGRPPSPGRLSHLLPGRHGHGAIDGPASERDRAPEFRTPPRPAVRRGGAACSPKSPAVAALDSEARKITRDIRKLEATLQARPPPSLPY
jgi:hypothetical protein